MTGPVAANVMRDRVGSRHWCQPAWGKQDVLTTSPEAPRCQADKKMSPEHIAYWALVSVRGVDECEWESQG